MILVIKFLNIIIGLNLRGLYFESLLFFSYLHHQKKNKIGIQQKMNTFPFKKEKKVFFQKALTRRTEGELKSLRYFSIKKS